MRCMAYFHKCFFCCTNLLNSFCWIDIRYVVVIYFIRVEIP